MRNLNIYLLGKRGSCWWFKIQLWWGRVSFFHDHSRECYMMFYTIFAIQGEPYALPVTSRWPPIVDGVLPSTRFSTTHALHVKYLSTWALTSHVFQSVDFTVMFDVFLSSCLKWINCTLTSPKGLLFFVKWPLCINLVIGRFTFIYSHDSSLFRLRNTKVKYFFLQS